jgi:hypothetical protein
MQQLQRPQKEDMRRDGGMRSMDLREILNKPEQAKKAARFMILTRLLGQYGAISENETA